MRNRAGILLVENEQLAVIKRTKGQTIYYVIPGGGVEEGESFEEAAKREAAEELGIQVENLQLALEFEQNGSQKYYFAGKYNGTLGKGNGEEYRTGEGTYLPCWIGLKSLDDKALYPEEVKSMLLKKR
ncbi:NUDIX domain-containing protein [Rossellomorea aquimaris]|uniref:NUDIX domain-containing protein n=1 Tax=Rossellomorea aquimaris TaxID=189382 RepID=UPI001CD4DC77|nr:NUDIX domain-containing protein [Rossellomorea aquimaris]MCA1054492.1 NUDIX domain-containing protein [Rossellomorea aquimaris]